MLGRFLEVSVYAPRILQSIAFYEALGFRQLAVGEVWSHPYSVLSDGRLNIGLHGYEFASPSLTFVLPDLAEELVELRARGLKFEFAKTGDDEFHEIGFLEPHGQMITVLEARTFSPPAFGAEVGSLCGRFSELSLPALDAAASAAYWERLGWDQAKNSYAPENGIRLAGCDVVLGIYRVDGPAATTLSFVSNDLQTCSERLTEAGFELRSRPFAWNGGQRHELRSPEGLVLSVGETGRDDSV